jgi:Lrp/AsnC family leucine-responsive transcriptional regulator
MGNPARRNGKAYAQALDARVADRARSAAQARRPGAFPSGAEQRNLAPSPCIGCARAHATRPTDRRLQKGHMEQLDKFDRAILDLLQRNARRTSEEIADAVGLSPTAVQRRIKRLRQDGVIRAEIAVLSPAAIGRGVTALVEVQLVAGSRDDLIDGFKRRMAAEEVVQQCWYVSGDADFILVLTATDMADYERITRTLFFGDENIKKFRTTFVLDAVKSGLQLPIG